MGGDWSLEAGPIRLHTKYLKSRCVNSREETSPCVPRTYLFPGKHNWRNPWQDPSWGRKEASCWLREGRLEFWELWFLLRIFVGLLQQFETSPDTVWNDLLSSPTFALYCPLQHKGHHRDGLGLGYRCLSKVSLIVSKAGVSHLQGLWVSPGSRLSSVYTHTGSEGVPLSLHTNRWHFVTFASFLSVHFTLNESIGVSYKNGHSPT